MCSLVTSVFLGACESWTLTAETEKKITAVVKMRCFCKFLGILYRDRVTNEEVRNRIRQASVPYEDLLTTVKKCKLKWYGHISRSQGLCQAVLRGTQYRAGEGAAGRKRDGRTTSQNGQALNWATPWESQRTERDGSWLTDYLWCPPPPRSTRLRDNWSEVKYQGAQMTTNSILVAFRQRLLAAIWVWIFTTQDSRVHVMAHCDVAAFIWNIWLGVISKGMDAQIKMPSSDANKCCRDGKEYRVKQESLWHALLQGRWLGYYINDDALGVAEGSAGSSPSISAQSQTVLCSSLGGATGCYAQACQRPLRGPRVPEKFHSLCPVPAAGHL